MQQANWQDLLSEQVRQLEAETGDPALATKAIALLRVNRFYEQRVRQLTLKAPCEARWLPNRNFSVSEVVPLKPCRG